MSKEFDKNDCLYTIIDVSTSWEYLFFDFFTMNRAITWTLVGILTIATLSGVSAIEATNNLSGANAIRDPYEQCLAYVKLKQIEGVDCKARVEAIRNTRGTGTINKPESTQPRGSHPGMGSGTTNKPESTQARGSRPSMESDSTNKPESTQARGPRPSIESDTTNEPESHQPRGSHPGMGSGTTNKPESNQTRGPRPSMESDTTNEPESNQARGPRPSMGSSTTTGTGMKQEHRECRAQESCEQEASPVITRPSGEDMQYIGAMIMNLSDTDRRELIEMIRTFLSTKWVTIQTSNQMPTKKAIIKEERNDTKAAIKQLKEGAKTIIQNTKEVSRDEIRKRQEILKAKIKTNQAEVQWTISN